MNKELLEALEQVEKEKNISKETLLEAIENSLLTACKNHFGKADNVKVRREISPCTRRRKWWRRWIPRRTIRCCRSAWRRRR